MKLSLLKHRAGRFIAAALVVGLVAGHAAADQRDPDLDGLYSPTAECRASRSAMWRASAATRPAAPRRHLRHQNGSELQRVTSDAAAKDVVAEIWQRWTAFEDDPRATSLMAIGVRQMNLGQLRNAERIFTEIISAHPTHAEAWNKRATVRFMRGDDKGSRSDIARVIDLEPRHFGALSGLGMINMRSGDLPAALQAFEAAVRVNPHMDQAEAMIRELRATLRGRAL